MDQVEKYCRELNLNIKNLPPSDNIEDLFKNKFYPDIPFRKLRFPLQRTDTDTSCYGKPCFYSQKHREEYLQSLIKFHESKRILI